MRVIEEAVEHIPAARHLIFAAVQLPSPKKDIDWDFDTGRQVWTWRPNEKNRRISEVQATLDLLLSDRSPKRPDVVIFPEYSVPKEAHHRLDFQTVARENSCIIVAGSYFEDSDTDPGRFRRNLCHVYLPHKVIIIGKMHAAPDEVGLVAADGLNNIARLVWHPPGRMAVSISIFLCRDYLSPFDEAQGFSTPTGMTLESRVSQLDWMREGINIVVMNNKRSQLFEGAAALDLRDLHGKRKAVLLSNCADQESDLGTALLVASHTRERGDVTVSLPPAKPGVLFAELRLWEVTAARIDPDTKKDVPLKHVEFYSINEGSPITLGAIAQKKEAPLARGVWHPAFLAEFRKLIVLDFFVAQSTLMPIVTAFEEGQIQHVKAGFLRGVHDVMIRRYVPRTIVQTDHVPLSLPFSHLSDAERRALFSDNASLQSFQAIIYPEKVLKYRGKPVPQGEAWQKAQAEIKRVIVRTDTNLLIERSCALAAEIECTSDMPEQFDIPTDLKPIFQLGVDHHVPAALQSGAIKEFYLFIRAQRTVNDETCSSEFRQQFVMDKLMARESIREICEIDSKPQKFHYAIQLETSPEELNELVYSMHAWAHEQGLGFGTRTYEIWKYLTRNSVAGIEHTTMEIFERDFLAETKRVAEDIRSFILPNAKRLKLASAWNSFRSKTIGLGECERYVGDFYIRVALHNFLKRPGNKNHLEDCQTAWGRLSMYVEERAEELLIKALQLDDDGEKEMRNEITKEVERRIPEKISKNKNWNLISGHPARIASKYYGDLTQTEYRLPRFCKHLDPILDKRNWVTHPRHLPKFKRFIDLGHKDWIDSFNKLEESTQQIVDALLDLEAEIDSLKR